MTYKGVKGPRAIALVGPYQSGKTSLLEKILQTTGTLSRTSGNGERLFGDCSAEARAQSMGTDLNVATTEFMDDSFYFLDCPGSLEYMQETLNVLPCIDAAVVVLEPELSKIRNISVLLKHLDQQDIPHFIFINKIDKASTSVREIVEALGAISDHPIVLRQLPIWEDHAITGYIDLAAERAYMYEAKHSSKITAMPADDPRIEEARYSMLETLADFDDHLMEELLEDVVPPTTEIYDDISKDTGSNLVVPVLLGSATGAGGVFRLLKAIRHDVPGIEDTCARRGISSDNFVAQVLKTQHTEHGGKRSIVRVLSGTIQDGDSINGDRIAGLAHIHGEEAIKRAEGRPGDIVALGRLNASKTGDILCTDQPSSLASPEVLPPVYEIALDIDNQNDEVRLISSLNKLCSEDPSISFEQRDDTHELVLMGQGEMHLRVAVARLRRKYGLSVSSHKPAVPYQETIQKGKTQHTRFRKQSGGHGQFGDVVIEVRPLERGAGFDFQEKIHGGSVPRQYIPSVEHGVSEYMEKGPLGFPVVDVGVRLTDGKHHAVDSSDLAFHVAGRMAMSEALPDCSPVLLEPIMQVKIAVPTEFTNKISGMISQRRGQIYGYNTRPGWTGWDEVEVQMPQATMQDMIVELRSLTSGVGSFSCHFDHMQELTGNLATQVRENRI